MYVVVLSAQGQGVSHLVGHVQANSAILQLTIPRRLSLPNLSYTKVLYLWLHDLDI